MFRFYFQNGDFIGEGIDCLKDILIPLGITIIGFSIPLFIQWLIDRSNEYKLNLNQINYFLKVIEKILLDTRLQCKHLIEYSKWIKKNPFDWDLISRGSGNDLDRQATNPNQQKLFESFLSVYGNNEESIKKFRETFSCIDHLYYSNLEFRKTIERAILNNKQLLFKYRDLMNELIEKMGHEMRAIEFFRNQHPFSELRNFLNEHVIIYHEIVAAKGNIPRIHTEFLEPFRTALIERYRNVPYDEEITFKCRRLAHLYNEIIGDTKDSAREIADEFISINGTKRKLEKTQKFLNKNFPSSKLK